MTENVIAVWDSDSSTDQLKTLMALCDKEASKLGLPMEAIIRQNNEVITGIQNGSYVMWLSVETGLNIQELDKTQT